MVGDSGAADHSALLEHTVVESEQLTLDYTCGHGANCGCAMNYGYGVNCGCYCNEINYICGGGLYCTVGCTICGCDY